MSDNLTKILKFDHGKVESVKTKRGDTGDIIVDLPITTIKTDVLPGVTILLVTRNRRKFAPLIIDNWKRIRYPEEKLQLLVVDDSDDVKMGPILELKALKDPRISYCYVNPIKDNSGNISGNSIGSKRNHGVNLAKYDYICIMDDDDFMFDDSILARMSCLICNQKQCIYSGEMGVYNFKHENSYILPETTDIAEGSLMFTKKFWETNKFSESGTGEGLNMVCGKELEMIKIPWFFNIVAINHNKNTTGKLRNVMFDNRTRVQARQSLSASLNIYKSSFPKSFKKALKSIV